MHVAETCGNYAEEARLYQKILDLDAGHELAKLNLAEMYANGEGVKQDEKKAAGLYKDTIE